MAIATINYSSITDTTAITWTLASLATSSTLLVGRESTIVDNTSNKFLDVLVSGQIMTGTTPTVDKSILIYVSTPLKVVASAFTLPIAGATALTGIDAAATFDINQRNKLQLADAINVAATSDRAYSFAFSIAQLFGGIMPLKWGLWVTHDTVAALNATAGNHWAHYIGIKADVT